jgi:hypothetical protein
VEVNLQAADKRFCASVGDVPAKAYFFRIMRGLFQTTFSTTTVALQNYLLPQLQDHKYNTKGLQKDGPPLHFQGVSAYLATVFPGNRV